MEGTRKQQMVVDDVVDCRTSLLEGFAEERPSGRMDAQLGSDSKSYSDGQTEPLNLMSKDRFYLSDTAARKKTGFTIIDILGH